jgi:hypothetical protein
MGPTTSFALTALFLGVAQVILPPSIVYFVASWLGYVKLGLAAFSLLPGFPLDGGRVLHLGHETDPRRADAGAFTAGQVVAYGLVLVGVTLAFGFRQFMSGLWIGFIGWFLLSAAQSSRVQYALREILGRLHASDVMRAPHHFMSPDTLVGTAVNEHVLKTGQRPFYVSDEGRFLGLVRLQELKNVPREDWRLLPLRASSSRPETWLGYYLPIPWFSSPRSWTKSTSIKSRSWRRMRLWAF